MSVNSATGTTIALENTIQGGVNDVDTLNLHVFGNLEVDGTITGTIPASGAAGTVTGAMQYRSATGTFAADDDFLYDPPNKKLKVDRVETDIEMKSISGTNSITITPENLTITNGTEINTIDKSKLAITGSGTNGHIHANATDFEIGTINNKPVSIITGNTERIFVDNNGDVTLHGTTTDLTWNATTDKLNIPKANIGIESAASGVTATYYPILSTVQGGTGASDIITANALTTCSLTVAANNSATFTANNLATGNTGIVQTNTITARTSSDLVIRGGNATSDVVIQTGALNLERLRISDAGVSMLVAGAGTAGTVYPLMSTASDGTSAGIISTDVNLSFNQSTNNLTTTGANITNITNSGYFVCTGGSTLGGVKCTAGGFCSGSEGPTSTPGIMTMTDNRRVANIAVPKPIEQDRSTYMEIPFSANLNASGGLTNILRFTHLATPANSFLHEAIAVYIEGIVFGRAESTITPNLFYSSALNLRQSFTYYRKGQAAANQVFQANGEDAFSFKSSTDAAQFEITGVTFSNMFTSTTSTLLLSASRNLSNATLSGGVYFFQGVARIHQCTNQDQITTTNKLPITAITVSPT